MSAQAEAWRGHLLLRNKHDGMLIQVDSSQVVSFYRQGGGFLQRTTIDNIVKHFDVVNDPKPYGEPVPSYVTGDWMQGGTFPCLLDQERWNGWRVPYFTKEVFIAAYEPIFDSVEGDRIILREDGQNIFYDPVLQAGGVNYYRGDAGWCWEEAEDVIPTQDH